MSKVGVLGSITSIAVGSYTGYTCPSNKGARVKFMFRGQGHASGTTITVNVNGFAVLIQAVPASNYFWSSTEAAYKEAAGAPDGAAKADTVAPCPATYYLAAGDTVSVDLASNAAISFLLDVVGVEVDVS